MLCLVNRRSTESYHWQRREDNLTHTDFAHRSQCGTHYTQTILPTLYHGKQRVTQRILEREGSPKPEFTLRVLYIEDSQMKLKYKYK